MLGKFKPGKEYILPLSCHAGVHFLFTAGICYIYNGNLISALLLGLLDFGLHFIMDRIKASPALLGKFKALSINEYKEIILNLSGKFTVNEFNDNANIYTDEIASRFIEEIKRDCLLNLKSNRYF